MKSSDYAYRLASPRGGDYGDEDRRLDGRYPAGATDNDVCRAGFDAMLAAGSDFVSILPIVTSGRRTGAAIKPIGATRSRCHPKSWRHVSIVSEQKATLRCS